MSRSGYRQLLKATFTQDFETVNRLSDELGDVAWKDSGLLVAAVFSLAVEERFPDGAELETIRDFVAEARSDFAASDTGIKPLVAEGVVRAALGEDDVLQDVPPLEGMQVQMALAHKIINEAAKTPAQIDALLDEAEQLLDQSL